MNDPRAVAAILILGSVTVRDDQLEQGLELARAHVARSRQEAGCIEHSVHRDDALPNRLVFIERWADAAVLRQHFMLPASREFARAIAAIAQRPPEMTVYEARPVAI